MLQLLIAIQLLRRRRSQSRLKPLCNASRTRLVNWPACKLFAKVLGSMPSTSAVPLGPPAFEQLLQQRHEPQVVHVSDAIPPYDEWIFPIHSAPPLSV